MSTIKSTTTKQEKTIDRSRIYLKLLPAGIFLSLVVYLSLNIFLKKNPANNPNPNSANGVAPIDGSADKQSLTIESTRRFLSMAQILSNSGYLRCDIFLKSINCPDSRNFETSKNLLYEIRHKVKKEDNSILKENTKPPYNTFKTMVVNTGFNGAKYIGVVLYSSVHDLAIAPKIINWISNEKCNPKSFKKWYFIEDPLELRYIEGKFHIKFKENSLPLQIIEKNGAVYMDKRLLAKKIINSMNSKPVLNCYPENL